jgi:endonuclease YncB( thermonuclease family)
MVTFGPYKGIVDAVHDGDTVNIRLDLGFDLTVYVRVRVFGINAPELSTDAGKKARDYAQALLPVGAAVDVVSHGWDKYGGRIDGDIKRGGLDFATQMLASNNAVVYTV